MNKINTLQNKKLMLKREVRLALNKNGNMTSGFNSFASRPCPDGLWIPITLIITGTGIPNQETGYLFDIHKVDSLVREKIGNFLYDTYFISNTNDSPEILIEKMVSIIRDIFPFSLYSVKWKLSEFHKVTLMEHPMPHLIISESFEFAAAHRLHCQNMTEVENKEIFGKCNNLDGHGHNYRLDIDIESPLNSPLERVKIEEIVHKFVLNDYDHSNLDLSLPDFKDKTSSVENIASACFNRLETPINATGSKLKRVAVWETNKTGCAVEADTCYPS